MGSPSSQSATVLKTLWRNWAISYGAVTLPLLVSLFVPRIWIPFIALAEAWALASIERSSKSPVSGSCSLVLKVASRIVAFTAVAMFLIVILCTDWLVPTVVHLDLYNSEIPFITCLVVFPATIATGLAWLYGGLASNYCRRCQSRNGYYAGDDIVATLYYRESRYQLSVLVIIALTLGIVEYWYYFARYINANLNVPDRIFFNYMPIVTYLLSLVFMAGRYASMRTLLNAIEDSHKSHRNRTVVRFLIFCADELLLHCHDDGTWDTPAEAVIDRTPSVSEQRASQLFDRITGRQPEAIRYCFSNDGFAAGSKMVHYAVFVSPEQQGQYADDNMWFNPYMLDKALATNSLNPVLANELYRIHTITMAWKTYDRTGKRLYPVRHYRPTFRLRDLRTWDVDYDDCSWFDVAHNNEDKPFYRLRSLWYRLTGLFNHKSRSVR